ncbi:Cytochrome c6 [Pseudoruegeria aquimaris]|uniref:Cytochrome c6 n=1 Tax=Pseudoruegeria aquimaris TaxID=393663 RepID=A0A1Y5T5K4_9RHOB|nr:cytochrome c [Pseudoruegeria aquimaris]SLN56307.1 Cytochrome c6 [Pseudoruegeria aquimaris]
MRKAMIGVALVLVALGGLAWLRTNNEVAVSGGTGAEGAQPGTEAMVRIVLPEALSENAVIGKRAFDANCAECHGANAAGQNGVAPPLVHKIYEPSHHGDESFQRAVAQGVRAHHWSFGNMPPVAGLSRADVAMIIAYVRELQRANGIE